MRETTPFEVSMSTGSMLGLAYYRLLIPAIEPLESVDEAIETQLALRADQIFDDFSKPNALNLYWGFSTVLQYDLVAETFPADARYGIGERTVYKATRMFVLKPDEKSENPKAFFIATINFTVEDELNMNSVIHFAASNPQYRSLVDSELRKLKSGIIPKLESESDTLKSRELTSGTGLIPQLSIPVGNFKLIQGGVEDDERSSLEELYLKAKRESELKIAEASHQLKEKLSDEFLEKLDELTESSKGDVVASLTEDFRDSLKFNGIKIDDILIPPFLNSFASQRKIDALVAMANDKKRSALYLSLASSFIKVILLYVKYLEKTGSLENWILENYKDKTRQEALYGFTQAFYQFWVDKDFSRRPDKELIKNLFTNFNKDSVFQESDSPFSAIEALIDQYKIFSHGERGGCSDQEYINLCLWDWKINSEAGKGADADSVKDILEEADLRFLQKMALMKSPSFDWLPLDMKKRFTRQYLEFLLAGRDMIKTKLWPALDRVSISRFVLNAKRYGNEDFDLDALIRDNTLNQFVKEFPAKIKWVDGKITEIPVLDFLSEHFDPVVVLNHYRVSRGDESLEVIPVSAKGVALWVSRALNRVNLYVEYLYDSHALDDYFQMLLENPKVKKDTSHRVMLSWFAESFYWKILEDSGILDSEELPAPVKHYIKEAFRVGAYAYHLPRESDQSPYDCLDVLSRQHFEFSKSEIALWDSPGQSCRELYQRELAINEDIASRHEDQEKDAQLQALIRVSNFEDSTAFVEILTQNHSKMSDIAEFSAKILDPRDAAQFSKMLVRVMDTVDISFLFNDKDSQKPEKITIELLSKPSEEEPLKQAWWLYAHYIKHQVEKYLRHRNIDFALGGGFKIPQEYMAERNVSAACEIWLLMNAVEQYCHTVPYSKENHQQLFNSAMTRVARLKWEAEKRGERWGLRGKSQSSRLAKSLDCIEANPAQCNTEHMFSLIGDELKPYIENLSSSQEEANQVNMRKRVKNWVAQNIEKTIVLSFGAVLTLVAVGLTGGFNLLDPAFSFIPPDMVISLLTLLVGVALIIVVGIELFKRYPTVAQVFSQTQVILEDPIAIGAKPTVSTSLRAFQPAPHLIAHDSASGLFTEVDGGGVEDDMSDEADLSPVGPTGR